MHRLLVVLLFLSGILGMQTSPTYAACVGEVCALNNCTGTVNVCPLAPMCDGTFNICPGASSCNGSVDVCNVDAISCAVTGGDVYVLGQHFWDCPPYGIR